MGIARRQPRQTPLLERAELHRQLGDFARAEKLQARAVAMSSFSAPLRDASVIALTMDKALTFLADVLGFGMLEVDLLLEFCVIARVPEDEQQFLREQLARFEAGRPFRGQTGR